MFSKLRSPLFAVLAAMATLGISVAQASDSDGKNDGAVPLHTAFDGQRAPKLIAYFTQWGIYSDYLVKNVATSGSAAKLTHINYAFGLVAPDTSQPESPVTCQSGDTWADQEKTWTAEQSVDGVAVGEDEPLRGNFQQLRQLKRLNPNLKVMISLGGWSWSAYFSNAALTPESRRTFAKSCVDLYIKGLLPNDPSAASKGTAAGVFDGIDIDWEYPGVCGNTCGPTVARPEDARNYTLLLQEFRRQLIEQGIRDGRSYLLTIAAPAGPQTFAHIELDKVSRSLDFINLMSYDYHGSWEQQTNFQSALFPSSADPVRSEKLSTDESVRGYLQAGVPADKLVVGVPAYSRGWQNVASVNNGLYQPGIAPADWVSNIPFRDAQGLLNTGTFTRFNDPVTAASWIYDPNLKIFWTYDDPSVMRTKARYVSALGLGGIMMWELSNDTDDGELIDTLAGSLKNGTKISNSASGMPSGDTSTQ